jgi:predicted PurR-regulated permease PerM
MKEVLIVVGIVLVIVLISYGSWRAEKWFNWRFSYGDKVNRQIEQLENRISELEHHMILMGADIH